MDANKKSVGLMAYDMEVQKFALNRFIWNMTEKILERIRVCDQALALLITDEPVVRAGMQAQEEKQVLLDTLNEIVKKYGPFDI